MDSPDICWVKDPWRIKGVTELENCNFLLPTIANVIEGEIVLALLLMDRYDFIESRKTWDTLNTIAQVMMCTQESKNEKTKYSGTWELNSKEAY